MSVRKDTGSEPDNARRNPTRVSVDNAVEAAKRYLLAIQAADGHWVGELEGDTILESEYILTMHFLGRTGEERIRKTAEHLRRRQLPTGGVIVAPRQAYRRLGRRDFWLRWRRGPPHPPHR